MIAVKELPARNPYRKEFFNAYPSANNSVLDDVPSHAGHCGVCHFDFGGGGPRNPYGLAVEATPNRDQDEDYDVDIIDLYLFSLQWMNTGCGGGDACGRADLHVDILDRANLKDFAVFANEWYYGL